MQQAQRQKFNFDTYRDEFRNSLFGVAFGFKMKNPFGIARAGRIFFSLVIFRSKVNKLPNDFRR